MPTKLTDAQIQAELGKLSGWEVQDGLLLKEFSFNNYLDGVAFASAVGVVCEGIGHHPEELNIGYQRVRLSFITHDIGNALSDADFQTAAAVDALGFPKA